MLTGVFAESSARRKEAWLSDDAWRAGWSKVGGSKVGWSKVGVPTLLNGLEKLKEGRIRPDVSELTDGDL